MVANMLWGERPLVGLLLVLMVLDVTSGMLAAFVTKTLSSSVSWQGGAKKALTFVIVATAYLAEGFLEGVPTGKLTTFFFVVTEALSILENATRGGVPIPSVLRITLAKAQQATEDPAKVREP